MECTGRITNIMRDFDTNNIAVTLSLTEVSVQGLQNIKDCEKLSISMKKWRAKRSLDANAYFHVLVGKIADVLTISKTRCKNVLICRYGQPELIEGEALVYKTMAPVSYMLEQESIHCQCIGSKIENDKELYFYKIFKGSHTYDAKEMSVLIDGTVQEAKDLGIETATPSELERMKQEWHV